MYEAADKTWNTNCRLENSVHVKLNCGQVRIPLFLDDKGLDICNYFRDKEVHNLPLNSSGVGGMRKRDNK